VIIWHCEFENALRVLDHPRHVAASLR